MNRIVLASFCYLMVMAVSTRAQEVLDRSVLPIPEPKRQTYTELDVRDAKAPKPFNVNAPRGAPNVVIVLIDDMGFGVADAFGGPVAMPNLTRWPRMAFALIAFIPRRSALPRESLC